MEKPTKMAKVTRILGLYFKRYNILFLFRSYRKSGSMYTSPGWISGWKQPFNYSQCEGSSSWRGHSYFIGNLYSFHNSIFKHLGGWTWGASFTLRRMLNQIEMS